jgi:membrane fusion protein (multidrug efflux system)
MMSLPRLTGVVPSIVAALALVTLGLSGAACRNAASARDREASGAKRAEGTAGTPRQVQVTQATADRIVRTIAVTGTLAAEEQVTLSFKVTGRLQELYVDLGSRVTKGQVIGRLVPTDFVLRVSQAEAALQQARARLGLAPSATSSAVDPESTAIVRQAKAVLDEAQLTKDRTETFVKRGITARAELDAAEAALKVADGRYQDALEEVRNRQALLDQRLTELELARQALRDSSLTAPLDGIVRERQSTAGQYLAAGSPVVTIVRVHPLRLRAQVPERDAPSVRLTQEVRVTLEGDPTTRGGRIVRISPAIDETTRTLMIEAEVPNPGGDLRPGSFANAEIVTSSQDTAILVPSSSIVTFAGVDKVLVVKDGRAAEKRVTIGRRAGSSVEIVAGLSAGEQVIIEPGNLVEGQPVSVARRGASSPPAAGSR